MFPVWSPDGETLLCLGEGRRNAEDDRDFLDWWVLPLDGSASRPIGLFSRLEKRNVPVRNASRRFIRPECWLRQHDLVVYSGLFEYSENLWAFSLPPGTETISRAPWSLTESAGRELFPSSTSRGQLVFTSVISNTDLWTLPVEGNSGLVVPADAELERLTASPATDGAPFLSADGKRLSFFSTRSGNSDVWLLEVGSDEPAVALTSGAEEEYRPVISPDGSRVAYQVPHRGIFIVDIVDGAAGPSTRLPVEDVFHPTGWTPDGRCLICGQRKSRPQVRSVRVLVDATTGEKTPFAGRPEYNLWQTQFSGDSAWVVCNCTSLGGQHKSQLFVFPYREGQTPTPQDWVAVSDGTAWDDKPRWSPDGNLLYFTSDRHGRCVWAQRLDEATKQRQGEPFEVFHLGSARRSMLRVPLNALEIAVSSDRLILTLEERVGNLWLAELVESG